MSTGQFLEQLRHLSDVERLEVIEVATRLIRDNLAASATDAAIERDRRMRAAAASVKDLYETGSELTEWTALDAEEFNLANCCHRYLVPKKSVFNRIIGDSQLELRFAAFLENCSDREVVSYAKNYLAVNFKLDYVNSHGDISNYYPDFVVKLSDKRIVIVETKGQEDFDVPLKMARLRQWCEDVNRVQADLRYEFVYVDEESFERYKPTSFQQLLECFQEYQGG